MSEHEEHPDPGRVRFVYTQAPDYRLAAANGAYGGLTPQGDYLVEFYCERPQSPMVEEHVVTPEGKLGQRVHGPSESDIMPQIERYVQFGILLTPAQARNLAQWILDNLRKMEERS